MRLIHRPGEGRQRTFAIIENQHAPNRRRTALRAIWAGTGAAAEANWRGFAIGQIHAPRGGQGPRQLCIEAKADSEFGANAAFASSLRVNGAGELALGPGVETEFFILPKGMQILAKKFGEVV